MEFFFSMGDLIVIEKKKSRQVGWGAVGNLVGFRRRL
jgi:hypothetical protein